MYSVYVNIVWINYYSKGISDMRSQGTYNNTMRYVVLFPFCGWEKGGSANLSAYWLQHNCGVKALRLKLRSA